MFAAVNARKEAGENITVHCSFLEIYQEVGYDLLKTINKTGPGPTSFAKVWFDRVLPPIINKAIHTLFPSLWLLLICTIIFIYYWFWVAGVLDLCFNLSVHSIMSTDCKCLFASMLLSVKLNSLHAPWHFLQIISVVNPVISDSQRITIPLFDQSADHCMYVDT